MGGTFRAVAMAVAVPHVVASRGAVTAPGPLAWTEIDRLRREGVEDTRANSVSRD